MIRAVPHVAAMAPYPLADVTGFGTTSLAQNESAFPTSPAALSAGREALERAPLYPDPDWCELRAAIAGVHGLDPARVLCGAGSMELIGSLIRAFAGPGDQVLGTEFGYLFVASAAAQARATHVRATEVDLTVSADRVLEAVTNKTRLVFVCNPGNPTGTRVPNAELIRLRENLPADLLLVIDQAYGEFDGDDPSAIFDLVERGDTVVLRTFSKAYGLAGARVGWGLFPEPIGGEVRKLLNPNNVTGVSQAMAAAAIRDQAHMQAVVARTALIRDRFADDLRAAGLGVPKSHTNFVLIRFADPATARAADAALRAAGILMRGMGGYGLPECLRATVGPEEVIDRALAVLRGDRLEA